MITEISVYNVTVLEIEAGRLPSPSANCTSVRIRIGADGASGEREWQVITLFVWDKPGEKFEDSEMASRIRAFNVHSLAIDPTTGSLTAI